MAAIEDVAVDATAAEGFAVAAGAGFGVAAGLAVVCAPRADASTSASTVQGSTTARSVLKECVRGCWFMGFSKLLVGSVSSAIVDSCAAGFY
jgi:hypothetical protein